MLKGTLDDLLRPFQGLRVTRTIPCLCQKQQQTPHYYDYEALEKQQAQGVAEVRCSESGMSIPLSTLLYGIHPSSNTQVAMIVQRNQQQLEQPNQSNAEIKALLLQLLQGQELLWRASLQNTHRVL